MFIFLLFASACALHFVGDAAKDFLNTLNKMLENILDASRFEQNILEHFDGAFIHRAFNQSDTSPHAWKQRVALKKIEQSCLFWKRRESYFCPDGSAKAASWQLKAGQPLNATELRRGTWMCDKPIAIDLSPWTAPAKTQADDVSISVYSGDNIIFSRAIACRDTWMQKFPNTSFLFSKDGDPSVSVIGMKHIYPRWFPENQDPVENLQLFAYKELLKRSPNAHWYYTIGDDTYVNKDYLLTLLDDLLPGNMTVAEAASTPRWIVLCENPVPVFAAFNTSRYESTWLPRYKAKKEFTWCTGATGWFLSRPAVELIDKELETFLELLYEAPGAIPWRNHHACDVTTGLLLTLLGVEPERPPNVRKWQNLFFAGNVESNRNQQVGMQRPHYHYVGPLRMLTLDQRAEHEKIDRIINAGRVDWLLESYRAFVNDHYSTLRRSMVRYRHLRENFAHIASQSWGEVPNEQDISNLGAVEDMLRVFKSSEPDVFV